MATCASGGPPHMPVADAPARSVRAPPQATASPSACVAPAGPTRLESAHASSPARATRPTKRQRRKQLRREATLITHVEASPATGLWREVVDSVAESSGQTSIYERRLQLLQLNMATVRGPHIGELGAAQATPQRNGIACVHARQPAGVPLTERPLLGFCFCIVPGAASHGAVSAAHGPLMAAIRHAGTVVQRTNFEQLKLDLLRCGSKVTEATGTDAVRAGFRFATGIPELVTRGHKDFKGVPREPVEDGGMYYPRRAPAHDLPGCMAMLDALLPILGADLRVAEAVPLPGGEAGVLTRLKRVVGAVQYPHFPKVVDVGGRPTLVPACPGPDGLVADACAAMHRMSISFACGSAERARLIARLPDEDSQKLEARINSTGKSLLHADPRDAGEHSSLLGQETARAAGVEVVTGGEEGRLLQLCHIISFGCTQYEALSAVGIDEGQVSFTLGSPSVAEGEGVRVLCYAIDYSGTWHGNGSEGHESLPPDAWVIRATAYATTHGATWAKRVSCMKELSAREFLRSCMGLPGSMWLGEGAKRGSCSRREGVVEESDRPELSEGVMPGMWVQVTARTRGQPAVEGWLRQDMSGRLWVNPPGSKDDMWLGGCHHIEAAEAPKRGGKRKAA